MKHKNVRKVGYEPTTLAVISAVGTAVGAATSIMGMAEQKKATRKAAEATDRQAKLQERLNAIEAQKQRVAALREGRIKRAQITTETTGGGVGLFGTSSSIGAIGAVGTQETTNIGAINTRQGFGQAIGQAGTEAYTAMGEAKGWSDIGAAGGKLFELSGGFESFKPFFKPSQPATGFSGSSYTNPFSNIG